MKIALKNVNSASRVKSVSTKRKRLAFCLLSSCILLGMLLSPAAAATNDETSPSIPGGGDTLEVSGDTSEGADGGEAPLLGRYRTASQGAGLKK